jgi:hypothetical protein
MGAMGNLKQMGPSTLDFETNGVGTILLTPVIPKFPFVKGRATYKERY